jgi:hypothetical protein
LNQKLRLLTRRIALLLLACLLGIVLLSFEEGVLYRLVSSGFGRVGPSLYNSFFSTFLSDFSEYTAFLRPGFILFCYFVTGALIALLTRHVIDSLLAAGISTFFYSWLGYTEVRPIFWKGMEPLKQPPVRFLSAAWFVISWQWWMVFAATVAGVVFALVVRFLLKRRHTKTGMSSAT